MKILDSVLIILGAAFAAIGSMIAAIFFFAFKDDPNAGPFLLIPLFFVVLGFCFIGGVIIGKSRRNRIIKRGKKYSAKIYGYAKNTLVTVNGQFTINTKVHYFDESGIEREIILPTGFSYGSSNFPIGMTIDIYELDGKYNYDPKSVRNEVLPREAELMDNKPLDPAKLNIIAINCPNCGASFEAASGYTSKCPYCDGFLNA